MTDAAEASPANGNNDSNNNNSASNGKTGLADALREHFSGDAPLTEKIQNFARAKPWASGMLVGVAGLLLAGSLRRKDR